MATKDNPEWAPIDIRMELDGRKEAFHGARVEGRGMSFLTAASRDIILASWRRQGREGRPEALKPLRAGGKVVGLAACVMGEADRIPLRWARKKPSVRVNLRDVLVLYGVTIPRRHVMDLNMTVHSGSTWGDVLVVDLTNPPMRPKKPVVTRKGKSTGSAAKPAAAAGPAAQAPPPAPPAAGEAPPPPKAPDGGSGNG